MFAAMVSLEAPLGAVAMLVAGAIIVSLVSGIVLCRFAERSVAWSSFLASVLGFTLAFSIVGLIPFDVSESLMLVEKAESDKDFGVPLHLMVRDTWSAIYWTTTVLCYLVIPFLIEFEAAGEFSIGARVRKSLLNNMVWYSAYAVIGVSAVIWMCFHGMELRTLGAWCIAASNAWGLILLTILMGFGLVALPRQLWNQGNPSGQLRALYPLATARDEAKKSAQYELQDAIAQAQQELEMRDTDLEDNDAGLKRAYAAFKETLEKCEVLQCELSGQPNLGDVSAGSGEGKPGGGAKPYVTNVRTVPSQASNSNSVAVLGQLVKLHLTMKSSALEARRADQRFEQLVTQCLFFEELEDERFHSAVELLDDIEDGSCCGLCRRALCRCHTVRLCWRRLQSIWGRWRSKAFHAASYACGLLSALIVLGQLTMLSTRFNLSVLSMFFLYNHGAVPTQVLCAIPLGYMTCTASWSVFRMKIAGVYGLYSHHNTDAGSLLWCAYSLARLALPLCYHFLLLIDVPPHLSTSFQEFMGQMVLVPILGHQMNQVFPCLVVFVVLCNVTQVYSRVVSCLGLSALEFDWSPSLDSQDPFAEGKELIERERRRRAEETAMELHRRTESGALAGAVPLRSGSSRNSLQ
jgi:hypothetical protein